MNDSIEHVASIITDLVSNNVVIQRTSQEFALQEINRTEIPEESDPLYQFYWELVATYITKVMIQVAQNQRSMR